MLAHLLRRSDECVPNSDKVFGLSTKAKRCPRFWLSASTQAKPLFDASLEEEPGRCTIRLNLSAGWNLVSFSSDTESVVVAAYATQRPDRLLADLIINEANQLGLVLETGFCDGLLFSVPTEHLDKVLQHCSVAKAIAPSPRVSRTPTHKSLADWAAPDAPDAPRRNSSKRGRSSDRRLSAAKRKLDDGLRNDRENQQNEANCPPTVSGRWPLTTPVDDDADSSPCAHFDGNLLHEADIEADIDQIMATYWGSMAATIR
eukprot:TRINITY_DN3885_c0_g1_i1.p1 TRINITY_DN3885_c0_g1~~TRINITY_DN3885_c0_g1_i1.p1  ORF type:complete len:259 (-),score=33.19 TRINITY_DN3885_c0_g1_i1:187-963(-)